MLLRSLNNLILKRLIQISEVIAVSGYADDKVLVLLRILLSVQKKLAVHNVELYVMAVHVEVGADVVSQVVEAFLTLLYVRGELLVEKRAAGL